MVLALSCIRDAANMVAQAEEKLSGVGLPEELMLALSGAGDRLDMLKARFPDYSWAFDD